MSAEDFARQLLSHADIEINGDRPWDIQVHNERLYKRVLRGGSLAFGESYMDGWWDAKRLDETIARMYSAELPKKVALKPATITLVLHSIFTNRQTHKRAYQVGEQHYNIGNDLYEQMLDPWLQYSCGFWSGGATDLASAQEAKLDLIARKLQLKPGMRVLEIGCGWGGLAKYLATTYDVQVDGITVSTEQAKLAETFVANAKVSIKVADYRTLQAESYDRIVSVGMFEHVGYKNYTTYMQHARRLLKADGIFLLHTIGARVPRRHTDPWIDKYIFPNGMLPSVDRIEKAYRPYFVLEDWHNFGADYDKTLMAWHKNFTAAWPTLQQSDKYDERFYRMWSYYLLACAGSFRSRTNQLWQIVLTKGLPGGYVSVR